MNGTESAPLRGYRIGVTAARKADEQTALLVRRGAEVEWAAALSVEPSRIDEPALRAATEAVLSAPVDMFIATTGIGLRSWFAAADSWGLRGPLLDTLARAEILARMQRAALHSNSPVVSDIDASIYWPSLGRVRRRYRRLLLPCTASDGSRLLFSANSSERPVPLRDQVA